MQADDVEGRLETGMSRVSGEPERRRAAQSPLLLPVDGLDGIPEVDPGAHLDLAEDQLRAATDDEVDLASSDARVRGEDPVPPDAVVEARAALRGPTGD